MQNTDNFLKTALGIVLLAMCASLYSAFHIMSQGKAEAQQDLLAIYKTPPVVQDRIEDRDAESNVFRVISETPYGVGGGTGYLVHTEEYGTIFLTNKHICDMDPPSNIFVADQDDGTRYLTKIIRKAKKTDLCILETPPALAAKHHGLILAPPTRHLQYGEVLYVYGHPGLRKLTGSHGIFINETFAAITETERGYIDAEKIELGRVDVAIFPGSSGSPVLDQEGVVVGTIFAYEIDTHMGLLIPIKEMWQFLQGEL